MDQPRKDKGRAIKELFDRDLEPLDLLKGLALGCYKPSLNYSNNYPLKINII